MEPRGPPRSALSCSTETARAATSIRGRASEPRPTVSPLGGSERVWFTATFSRTARSPQEGPRPASSGGHVGRPTEVVVPSLHPREGRLAKPSTTGSGGPGGCRRPDSNGIDAASPSTTLTVASGAIKLARQLSVELPPGVARARCIDAELDAGGGMRPTYDGRSKAEGRRRPSPACFEDRSGSR